MRVRLTSIAAVLSGVVIAGLAVMGTAHAAPVEGTAAAKSCVKPPPRNDDTVHIVGCLTDTRNTPPSPVEGVKLTVVDSQGKQVAEGTSDATGVFDLPLPGKSIDVLGKSFTVNIDVDTLPKGSFLTDKGDVSRTFDIKIDSDIAVDFSIGPDLNAEDPVWDRAIGLTVSGLITGLLLAMAAIGLSLVFGTTGLTNFAHGELITFGAIVAFYFESKTGMPIIAAGVIAVILSGVLGLTQDLVLWKPLRKRGTGLVAMMIISIGLSISLRNLYQYFVGGDSRNYTQYATVTPWQIGPLELTSKDLIVALVCIATLIVVSIAVQKTRIGKATRAVSDNPALAASSGINVDRVITVVWIVGTALAGMSGFLFAMTQGFDYQVGFKILLLVFASVTLGGLGTIWGAMAGGIIVGLLIELSTLVVNAELKYVGALVVMILVLLVRPQGLLGRPERVG